MISFDIWRKTTYEQSKDGTIGVKTGEELIVFPATDKERERFDERKEEDIRGSGFKVRYKRIATLSREELQEILAKTQ